MVCARAGPSYPGRYSYRWPSAAWPCASWTPSISGRTHRSCMPTTTEPPQAVVGNGEARGRLRVIRACPLAFRYCSENHGELEELHDLDCLRGEMKCCAPAVSARRSCSTESCRISVLSQRRPIALPARRSVVAGGSKDKKQKVDISTQLEETQKVRMHVSMPTSCSAMKERDAAARAWGSHACRHWLRSPSSSS